MVLAILMILLGICLTIDISMGYNESEDDKPNKIGHRIIRSLHDWIYDGEDVPQE